MGYVVGQNSRSLGQALEKHCVLSRGHIFSSILMKLSGNVFLNEMSDEYERELFLVEN